MKAQIKKVLRFNKWAVQLMRESTKTNGISFPNSYYNLAKAYFVQHFSLEELKYYGYLELSPTERKQLVPRKEDILFLRKVNNVTESSVLSDKRKCYLFFKDFYRRDVLAVSESDCTLPQCHEEFIKFVRKHDRVILKPISECEGRGVCIVESSQYDDKGLTNLLSKYNRGFMAEEKVIQCDFMSSVHPKSVNTIRINTVRYNDGVEVLWPTWRIGRGDSVVDNYSSGGISVTIDAKSGVTLRALSKDNRFFTTHPDTGSPLVGIHIPCWDELCELVCQLANKLKDIRFVGWDMSLTDDGWVLIEANYEPDNKAWQLCSGVGIREDLERIKHRLAVD